MAYCLSPDFKSKVPEEVLIDKALTIINKMKVFLDVTKKKFVSDFELGGNSKAFVVKVNNEYLYFLNHEIVKIEDTYGVGESAEVMFDFPWVYGDGMIIGEKNFPTPPTMVERKFVIAKNQDLEHYGSEVFDVLMNYETMFNGEEYQEWVEADGKIGRNTPCPCGSGKKYKRCCDG